MSEVKLQFLATSVLGSKFIEWFSAGHLSHVDALTESGDLLGAMSHGGVALRQPYYKGITRQVIFTLPASMEQYSRFWGFLTQQIGKPFDWRSIWAFVLHRDWREDDSWICSELQAAALESAGLVPKLYLASNKITPVSLALALSAMGAKMELLK